MNEMNSHNLAQVRRDRRRRTASRPAMMSSLFHSSLVFLFCCYYCKICSTTEMDSKALSSTIAAFSARFCNELEKNKSVISSPLSAEFVLALLTLGTSGTAHTELLSALGIPNEDAIRSSFTSLATTLKSIKGVTLNIANKVYLKDGPYELNSGLEQDAVKVFDAGIEKVNFTNGAAAAAHINGWVESKTNNKIKDLLSADSLNDDTRLVLVNALYFKGFWSKKFNPNNTSDQPFYIKAGTTVPVPMMYREGNYSFGVSEGLNAQLLQLPYEGNQASMLIILPNEIEGLNGVLTKLAEGHDLIADMDKMFSNKVQVTIPKFKIETEIDLADLLPKLGIKAIFDRNNSGLTKLLKTNEPLVVNKAVQKAFIEVNEEGAEAAAATVGGVRTRRSAPTVQVFTVNRPALWCLLVERQVTVLARYQPGAPPPPHAYERRIDL